MSEDQQNNQELQVDSYQKVASLGGWAGAGRTLWAIGTLGTIAGAAIGLAAPILPAVVLGQGIPLAVMGASVATFASIGMAMGFTGGLMLGRISGSNSAVAEEQEKRLKSWMTTQLKQVSPNYKEVPAPTLQVESVKRNALESTRDIYETYVNPSIGITMAAVGALAGLILSAGYLSSGGQVGVVGPLLESVTGVDNIGKMPTALIAYTTGVTASFGALFTFNFPKITSNMTDFTGRLLGGQIIGRTWEPQRQQQAGIEQAPQLPTKELPSPEPTVAEDPFGAPQPTTRFTDKLAQPEENKRQMILKQQTSTTEIHVRS